MSLAADTRALFRAFLRQSHKFPNYNIREYIKRRAREYFRKEVPENTVMERLNFAREQLEVVKRQSIVYGLYSRRDLKNVMELREVLGS